MGSSFLDGGGGGRAEAVAAWVIDPASETDVVGPFGASPTDFYDSKTISDAAANSSVVGLGDDASPPFDLFEAIDLYVTPVWYVLGIPGNILAYCVWTRRRMRLSSGCYLAALAMDESIFLLMQASSV